MNDQSRSERLSSSRRTFLVGFAGIATLGSVILTWQRQRQHGTLLSAFEDARGEQYIGGIVLDSARVFGVKVPLRAHGCAVDPRDPQRVVFFARRPGTLAFELRRDSMQVRTVFATPAGRHLAGHGLYSPDDRLLFTPEHDYQHQRGVISVRDTRDFRIIEEIDTRGIDPHELAWLPDGRSMLVANGGILTHPRSFRRKLNIPTMDPSLCIIDSASGDCAEQWRLPDHLLSIRHLAVGAEGVTAVGLQYEGAPANAPGMVALYKPGAGLRLLEPPVDQHRHFRSYVASVTISEQEGLIAAACPYDHGVACWSTSSGHRYIGFVPAAESYGLSRLTDGSVVVSQRDGTAFAIDKTPLRSHFLHVEDERPIRWDDHWVAV